MKRQNIFIIIAIMTLLSLAFMDGILDKQHEVAININNRYYQALEMDDHLQESFYEILKVQNIPTSCNDRTLTIYINLEDDKRSKEVTIASYILDHHGKITCALNKRTRGINPELLSKGISIHPHDTKGTDMIGYVFTIKSDKDQKKYGFIIE